MPSQIHEGLCAFLAHEWNLETRGFAPWLREWVGEGHVSELESAHALGRKPDGFKITHDLLLVVEVAVDHPPSSDLLIDYAMLWFTLDTYGFDMALIVVDRYGQDRRVNLQRLYFAYVTQLKPGES